MVSINLSDLFHDMLILQALRPVSLDRVQKVPSIPPAPLEVLSLTRSPADALQEKGGVRINDSWSARNMYLRRDLRSRKRSIGDSRVVH